MSGEKCAPPKAFTMFWDAVLGGGRVRGETDSLSPTTSVHGPRVDVDVYAQTQLCVCVRIWHFCCAQDCIP